MRITYIHQYFNTPEMSGSTRSYEMARRLVALGHEVNIVTSLRDPDDRSTWFVTDEDGINVHWLPVHYSNHLGNWARIRAFLKFAIFSGRRASSLVSDIVFASSTPLTIALPGIYASWKRRVPFVFEVRDLWPEIPIAVGALRNPVLRRLACLLERFAYTKSAAVVTLSPGMRDGVVATGYPADRVTVIPNGADLEMMQAPTDERHRVRARLGVSEDSILVVYTGTFGMVNGVGYIVDLAEQMKIDRNVVFLTVGDGKEVGEVRARAQASGCLGRNFLMMPAVPKNEIPALLAAADIALSVVIPLQVLEANSANKVFDALAAGRCVAINHGGWQEQMLVESGAGFRLARDVRVAADQLRRWLAEPLRIIAAGKRARLLAEARFSRDVLATQLEQVFQSVVEPGVAGNSGGQTDRVRTVI
jgi:glycosyltransferase involved in cell wall biosynthesis